MMDNAAPRPTDYWREPMTRGFAAALTAVNLAALAWFAGWQNGRLDDVERSVSLQVQEAALDEPPAADPATCWLIGANARAAGHSKELLSRLAEGDALDVCFEFAQRGALGTPLSR